MLKKILSRKVNGWEWLPLLASPFIFGAIYKVFPIDDQRVLVYGSVIFIVYTLSGVIFPIVKRVSPFFIGVIFSSYLVSTPFWAMHFKDEKLDKDSKFAIFFDEARADPEAFSRWWTYYVGEVVRTNKIVFRMNKEGLRTPQGEVTYMPIPNATANFYKGQIKINNKGYRGENFADDKSTVFRILAVGDSTTFGQTIFPDSKPWPAALQQLIAEKLVCAKKIEVVNGGVNNYHLINSIERIERDHQWLKPDMVLSYIGWNSMAELGIYPKIIQPPVIDAAMPADTFHRVKWYARKTLAQIANEEILNLARIFSIGDDGKSNTELLKETNKGLVYQHYHQMIAQSRRLHYKLVLLSSNTSAIPSSPEFVKKFYEGPWPGVKAIIKQIEIHNLMIEQLSKQESDISYIYTGQNLNGEYNARKYIDVVHFSPLGDRLMAENIYKKLGPMLIADQRLQCRPAL